MRSSQTHPLSHSRHLVLTQLRTPRLRPLGETYGVYRHPLSRDRRLIVVPSFIGCGAGTVTFRYRGLRFVTGNQRSLRARELLQTQKRNVIFYLNYRSWCMDRHPLSCRAVVLVRDFIGCGTGTVAFRYRAFASLAVINAALKRKTFGGNSHKGN